MAFQRNGNQENALQTGAVTKVSTTAFQSDAFQGDGFQIGAPGSAVSDPHKVNAQAPFVTTTLRSRRFQTAPIVPVFPAATAVPFTAYAPITTHRRLGWRKEQRAPDPDSYPATPVIPGDRTLSEPFITTTLRSRRFQTAIIAPVFPSSVPTPATLQAFTPVKTFRRHGWNKERRVPEQNTYPSSVPTPATLPAYAPIKTFRRHGWFEAQRAPELDRFAQITTSAATLPAYAPIKTHHRAGWRKEQRALELDSRAAATPVTATDRAVDEPFITRIFRSRRFQTSPPCPTAPLPRVDAVFTAWRQPDVHRRHARRPEVQINDLILSDVVQPYMAWNTRPTHRRHDQSRRESQNPTPLDFIAKPTPNFPAWMTRPVKLLKDPRRKAIVTVPIEHIGKQATNYPSWETRPVRRIADHARKALRAPEPILTAIPTSSADIGAWATRPVKRLSDPRRKALRWTDPLFTAVVQPFMAWNTRPVVRRASLARHRQEVLTNPYNALTPAEFSFAAVMTPRILRRHGQFTEQRALIPPVYPPPAAPVLPSTDIRDIVIRPFLIEHWRKML